MPLVFTFRVRASRLKSLPQQRSVTLSRRYAGSEQCRLAQITRNSSPSSMLASAIRLDGTGQALDKQLPDRWHLWE